MLELRDMIAELPMSKARGREGEETVPRHPHVGGLAPSPIDRIHFWHMSHTITIRLDSDLAAWLARESSTTGVSQGKIVRDQLELAKAAAAAQSFMRLAGAVRGGPRDVSTRKGFSRK